MIHEISTLNVKFDEYKNIPTKINTELKAGNILRIKRGLYVDNIDKDYLLLANLCYGPSYISFEYALSFYGMIPEKVSCITSATYSKKNRKLYRVDKYSYSYQNVPKEVFPYGLEILKDENGNSYKIASKEKALCDLLYSCYPVRSIKDLTILLFDNLRIDIEEIDKLNFDFIFEIGEKYHSNTINTFITYLKRRGN